MCKLYDLFSAQKTVQIWRKFHFFKSRNVFFTASKWILRLYEVNIGHIKVKNKFFLIIYHSKFKKFMQKNTIYVDHDSKLVAEKFRDGADLLQIRLCTQISCPLLVAVNFRNSFWSAKNTGRSQEYFLQLECLRENIPVLHFMIIVGRKWGLYELFVVPYLVFCPYSTKKIFLCNVNCNVM